MIRRYIQEWARIPDWYGPAWFDFCRNRVVCYPIPLNLIMRGLYVMWVWALSLNWTRAEKVEIEIRRLKAANDALTITIEQQRAIESGYLENDERLRAAIREACLVVVHEATYIARLEIGPERADIRHSLGLLIAAMEQLAAAALKEK